MTVNPKHTDQLPDADVVLIGAGIMSATLSSMLTLLAPDLRILVLEQAEDIAGESSDSWNNAGTGHSGYCELNYMPDPADGAKPAEIAGQFHLTRQWWAHLVRLGLLDPADFIHSAPHMNLVFGDTNVTYLRRRVDTLKADPLFSEMEYTEDPDTIARWAPLTMEGRADSEEPMAAARHPRGTDVDFGALTSALLNIGSTEVRAGHTVTGLESRASGWTVSGSTPAGPFAVHAKTVFVGAGGLALRLLQKARIPEVRGYAVLPVGAAFYRCSTPAVVARHDAKVYGQADVGAPPMSVPHLDRRVVDGKEHLLFGPYATFSTKLLKQAFPAQWHSTWKSQIAETVPDLDRTDWTAEAVARSHATTEEALGQSPVSLA